MSVAMSSELPRTARGRVRLFESRIRRIDAAVEQIAEDAVRLADSAEQSARARLDGRRAKVEQSDPDSAIRAAHDATAEAMYRQGPEARRLAQLIAPGLASADLNSRDWTTEKAIGTGGTGFVRVGTLSGEERVPMLVPLLGVMRGWSVEADETAAAHRLIQSVLLRSVGYAPPFKLRVDAYDPALSGATGVLGHVSLAQPQIVAPVVHAPEELRQLLAELRTVSAQRAARLAQLGYETFDQMLAENPHVADAHRFVVLLDYPVGIDAQTQRELLRLVDSCAGRGIGFLVHHVAGTPLDNDVDPADLLELLEPIKISGDRLAVEVADLDIRLDQPASATVVAELCEAIVENAKRAELPTLDFGGSLPPREQWWQPALDELSTVIGLADRTPATISLRSANPPLPHILLGGAVGQGKSNLLLVLVHGLAARYAPHDLEMYLLDFKHGVEFAALGPSEQDPTWLPHVRVLGVHSDIPFGLAVLGHLIDELERRSDLFKAHGNLTDIAEFAIEGDRPPRILLVLDEFQILFEDDEHAEDAARMIEKLVRLGRAYGIHVVLSTQTIDGMQRLAVRKDSIFGQVPYRIALKSTQADSQALLRTENTAAAELRFRGEAIVNANFGSADDNQHVIVAYAERSSLARLREELWGMDDQPTPPRVFHLAESASLVLALSARDEAASRDQAWAGTPISVAETPAGVPLRGEPGAGVVVLGDDEFAAFGVLSGLAVSAAATAASPPSVVVLDGVGDAPGIDESKTSLTAVLKHLGCVVDVVSREHIADKLSLLRSQVEERTAPPTYVLGLGLHGVDGMTSPGPDGFSRPADDLEVIVRDGPARGVFTFAWWNRLHVCTSHLGYERANVSTYLFLRHPQDGVRSVCGPLVRWTSEPHRALLWDGMGDEPQVVVPFGPLTDAQARQIIDAEPSGSPS